MKAIEEGKARIIIPSYNNISREMPVFYNPAMKLNRDISILILDSIPEMNLLVADPLAGSGIRSIRFLLELKKNKIKKIYINDNSKLAVRYIKKNLKENKIRNDKISLGNNDANVFLLESSGFSYIDIDPFGYPGKFWDSAIKRISRKGILAVTATDTSALCGSAQNACLRKYNAKPLRNECMHELGLRILIKALQSVGAHYDKALTPIFSYSKEHYMRIFLSCEKSRKAVDNILKNQGYFLYCPSCLFHSITLNIFNLSSCPNCKEKIDYAGPLWLGDLWDKNLLKSINVNKASYDAYKLLERINGEADIAEVGLYDTSKIAEKYKINLPKMEIIINRLVKKHKASRTHFSDTSIRTDANIKEIIKIIRKN